jgi:hypothetical protein
MKMLEKGEVEISVTVTKAKEVKFTQTLNIQLNEFIILKKMIDVIL